MAAKQTVDVIVVRGIGVAKGKDVIQYKKGDEATLSKKDFDYFSSIGAVVRA